MKIPLDLLLPLLLGAALSCLSLATPANVSASPIDDVAAGGITIHGIPADTVDSDTVPDDTYADPQVRRLVREARAVRERRDTTLRSHEVTWRERVYIGVSSERFRRERALLHQQRAARVRWSLAGDRTVRWLGTRRQSPVADTRVEFTSEFDFLDPGSDRLFLGGGWAVHPLADSAAFHYRYRHGDTLGIRTADRRVTLVEVVVEPREARFDLVAGSFWFDADSGVLARAAYRPAKSYDLEQDDPEDAEDVPGLLRPIRAAVDYVVVDYSLQELRWWLPRRMAFEGRLQLGAIAGFPFQAEWSFEDYEVNAPDRLVRPGPLEVGWRRVVRTRSSDSVRRVEIEGSDTVSVETWARGEEDAGEDEAAADEEAEDDTAPIDPVDELEPGDWRRLVVVIPPADSLRSAPELPEPFGRGELAFDPDELSDLRDRISSADVPRVGLPGPRLEWGSRLLRYNRVEALSAGARLRVPVGAATRLEASLRLGVADLEPNVELGWRHEGFRGEAGVTVYRRLRAAGDWGAPLGFGNSMNTLLLGYDDGLYYRTLGAQVTGRTRLGRVRLSGAAFGERHRSATRGTDVTLPGLFGDDLRPNIRAEAGSVAGVRGELRFQSGVDPTATVVSGRAWGEGAAGDFDYGRGALSVGLTTPTARRWVGAVEAAAGTTSGGPPLQRQWFLGGSYTLRGFEAGAVSGAAFWMGRVEVSRRIPVGAGPETEDGGRLLRAAAFLDAGWAGARGDFGDGEPSLGAGAGVSILDGLFRLDVARGFTGGGDWRLHLYSDGLL